MYHQLGHLVIGSRMAVGGIRPRYREGRDGRARPRHGPGGAEQLVSEPRRLTATSANQISSQRARVTERAALIRTRHLCTSYLWRIDHRTFSVLPFLCLMALNRFVCHKRFRRLAYHTTIRMASTIKGQSGRVYVQGEQLQRHREDLRYSIFKAKCVSSSCPSCSSPNLATSLTHLS